MGESMRIGDLAERFGLAAHVLRHWESMGLLRPGRDGSGRRRYGEADLTWVVVILRAKEAGLSLETIRLLAAASEPVERRAIRASEAEALRARIAAAQASLALIECALDCEHEDFTQCAHLRQMVSDRIGAVPVPHIPI